MCGPGADRPCRTPLSPPVLISDLRVNKQNFEDMPDEVAPLRPGRHALHQVLQLEAQRNFLHSRQHHQLWSIYGNRQGIEQKYWNNIKLRI